MTTQQPMASDLRRRAAILHVVTDLERTGDYAAGIARICVQIGDEPLIEPLIDIPVHGREGDEHASALRLTHASNVMLPRPSRSLERTITSTTCTSRVYREPLTSMLANPHTIDQAMHLLWVAHNLERVADRVQNIRERVVFVVTGRMQEFSRGGLG